MVIVEIRAGGKTGNHRGIMAGRKKTGDEIQTLFFGTFGNGERITFSSYESAALPKQLNGEFGRCRYLLEQNPWVLLVQRLWLAFYNHGFRLEPALPLKKRDQAKFDEWNAAKGAEIAVFVQQLWQEFLSLDNGISYWERSDKPEECIEPFLLAPERCRFTDRMGRQIIHYTHGLTQEELEGMSAEQKRRYSRPEITLRSPEDSFRVLKRARVGDGFGRPRMRTIFRPAAAYESMEVGEVIMAFLNRCIFRWHKMGQEPKANAGYTPNGKLAKFSPERWEMIKKDLKNKLGLIESAGNYDHEIKFIHPPTEYFDSKKWDGFVKRFWAYAGPLGQMMQAEGLNSDFSRMLRAEAEQERLLLRAHLEPVIREGYAAPCPVTVAWSNACFYDNQKYLEAVQWGVQQGPVALRDWFDLTGMNWGQSQARKESEAALPEAQIKPRFDQAHGDPKSKGGRPAGTPDGDNNPGQR